MKYYALYDDNDRPLGIFKREELEKMLNTTKKSFICILSRINTGNRKYIIWQNKRYRVYVYKERENGNNIFNS